MDIRYDRSGNYSDYVLDATSGRDVKRWMSIDLGARALRRVQEFDSLAGSEGCFLSFQERVQWALSEATTEQALVVIRERAARYAAGQHTDTAVPW